MIANDPMFLDDFQGFSTRIQPLVSCRAGICTSTPPRGVASCRARPTGLLPGERCHDTLSIGKLKDLEGNSEENIIEVLTGKYFCLFGGYYVYYIIIMYNVYIYILIYTDILVYICTMTIKSSTTK